jgi:hypothetical protein
MVEVFSYERTILGKAIAEARSAVQVNQPWFIVTRAASICGTRIYCRPVIIRDSAAEQMDPRRCGVIVVQRNLKR